MTHTRFAFVKAQWHADIVDRAYDGFIQDIPAASVDVCNVPGAFELPLMARDLAQTASMMPSFAPPLLWMAVSTAMILWCNLSSTG